MKPIPIILSFAVALSHVGAGEQARIQHAENAQSAKIYDKKHNARQKL